MAAKSGLSWVNHVDGAATILSVSSQAGDLAPSNMANPIVGRRCRLSSTTGYGEADFGADKTVGAVCLVFPRDTSFPLSGTVTHAFDADGGTAGAGATLSSGALSIGTADGYGYHFYKLTTAISARYWRFTFNVTGVDYIDIGRAWAGEWFVPTYDPAFGFADSWEDLSRGTAAQKSGAEYWDPGPRQRGLSFSLAALDSSEASTLRELARLAGASSQVLFCKDTTAPARETLLGRLAQPSPILQPDAALFTKTFNLRESV